MEKKEHQKTRQLGKDEEIPYDILLLADETIEAINKYIFDSEIYVLEKNSKIIAEYALLPLNKEEIEIKNIAVSPEVQGQGIGKSLLRDAAARAKARGFKIIIVGTGDTSTKLLRFYHKEDFEVFGVRKGFFVDNYPEPIYDGEKQLKDMVLLKKEL